MTTVETATVALAYLTGILVFITGVYAYLTWRLVKATNTPIIAIYLKDGQKEVVICVDNKGTGAAHNIEFPEKINKFNEHDLLSEISFLKSGIKYLAPNRTVEVAIHRKSVGQSMERILKECPITIVATYARSAGKFKRRHKRKFEVEYWDFY